MAETPEDNKRAEVTLHQDPEEEMTEVEREEAPVVEDQNLQVSEREVMIEVEAGTFPSKIEVTMLTDMFNNQKMVILYLPQLSLLTW